MSSALWRAEGAALAPLDDVTVLLLVGESPTALAAVARGAAATAGTRRVAVFDLAGAFGRDEPDGLIAAFRDGRSLNALARPLDDGSDEWFVVPRGPGELQEPLVSDQRWPRLVEGFKSTGALLILVVPLEFRSARRLVPLADRALRLTTRDGAFKLIAFPEANRITPTETLEQTVRRAMTPPDPMPTVPSAPAESGSWRVALVLAVIVLSAGGWYWSQLSRAPVTLPAVVGDTLPPADGIAALAPDTLDVPEVVNPPDSIRAAQWAVELVATNDRADANLRLAERSTLKAGTISPVFLGEDPAPWYKIIAGAYVDRTAAELLRRALRQVGTIEPEAGVVARVPFAFRLDSALSVDEARTRAVAYVARGIAAYALVGDDDLATVYAGAFSSPEQSVLLSSQLRAAGIVPQLAYRVGRTY